jgi:glycosyltransferase involved in cell wall biosynthesis
MNRPCVLHLAIEYNDPHRPRTTNAVERLVAEAVGVDNVVFSMRRRSLPWQRYAIDCITVHESALVALGFWGLPGGLFLALSMWMAAGSIARKLESMGLKPDLVHAHKLTFEGLAAYFIARRYGIPLMVSLRGEVETKVFRWKPSYRPLLRAVCRRAIRIFHVSAWFVAEFHRSVAVQPAKEQLLPNFVSNVAVEIVPRPAQPRFLTVLNFDIYKKKGLHWLLTAFARFAENNADVGLDIVGTGRADSIAAVEMLIHQNSLEGRVKLLGPVANVELLRMMPDYMGLLLPSVNETFGMVYVEALFAGIPILYTAGTGIDGYLDGLDVGCVVRRGDVAAMSLAIERLAREAGPFRARIAAAALELYARFNKVDIIRRYLADIRTAVEAPLRPVEQSY